MGLDFDQQSRCPRFHSLCSFSMMALRTSASGDLERFSFAPQPIHLWIAWRDASLSCLILAHAHEAITTLGPDAGATRQQRSDIHVQDCVQRYPRSLRANSTVSARGNGLHSRWCPQHKKEARCGESEGLICKFWVDF